MFRGREGWRTATLAVGFAGLMAAATTVGASALPSAPQAKTASTTSTGLVVSVSYAENVGDIGGVNAWFPTPWCTSPTCSVGANPSKVTFIGQADPNTQECAPTSSNPTLTAPYCWDEGGVRLDNPTSNPITVSGIAVNVRCNTSSGMLFYGGSISPTGFGCGSGRTRQLWAGSACTGCFFPLTIQPGKSVILTGNPPAPAHQNTFVNFDSSDTPHGLCNPPASAAPTVTIVSNVGSTVSSPTTESLTDSAHVLDTGWWINGNFGGTDSGWCPHHQNESVQWEPISWPGRAAQNCTGTCTPLGLAATLTLSPSTASLSTGAVQTLTATLLSGDGVSPLANAPVAINVTSGPDAGQATTNPSYTDASGNVQLTVQNNGTAGADSVVATAGFIGPFHSNTACVVFGSGTCGTPPPPNDFSINASPNSVSVAPGSSTSTTINTAVTSGSAQSISLSASGLPANANANFSPSSVTAGGSSTMNITTMTSTPTGKFTVTVTGTGTSATHSTTVTLNVTSSPPPPPGCPAGWTCSDIGSPTPAGSESFDSGTGAWTINAGGSDIFSSADHFRFDYQSTSNASATVQAHITGQTNTNAWAKAGVMMRLDTTAGSAQFSVLITPGNGIFVEYRLTDGATTTTRAGTVPGVLPPQYIRIVRSGTSFTGAYSSDNSTWHTLFTQTVAAMSGTVLEGLAATSHNTSALCTVTMDTVSVS